MVKVNKMNFSNATRARKESNLKSNARKLVGFPEFIVRDLRDSFSVFDPNKSGFITVGNLKAILQNFGLSHVPRKEVEDEIHQVIGSANSVDWNDTVAIVSRMYKSSYKEAELRETFKVFDVMGRGKLSYEDFRTGFREHCSVTVPEADIAEMLRIAGVNRNADITFEDFVRMLDK